MCLILLAYQVHPDYPLILAANRDEFYQRPTAPAEFWKDNPLILAGRDLEKMGTWLGITKTGRFAAVTNYRNPQTSKGDARTRGELVSHFLATKVKPEEYLQEIKEVCNEYQGFNLLLGEGKQLYYYSNIENMITAVKPGIHGLSNALLNTAWPKVVKGKEALAEEIQSRKRVEETALFRLLSSDQPFPDKELPNTGVSLDWERRLSPLFISSTHYGTRSSTVLTIDRNGKVNFSERTFSSSQTEWSEVHYSFKIEEVSN